QTIVDPLLALNMVPSANASFLNLEKTRSEDIIIDCDKIEDINDILHQCPHAALGIKYISIKDFVNSIITQMHKKNYDVDRLKKINRELIKTIQTHLSNEITFDKILIRSMSDIENKHPQKSDIEHDFVNFRSFVPSLFFIMENQVNEGQITAIAIDSEKCNACKACMETKNKNMILSVDQNQSTLENLHLRKEIFDIIPITNSLKDCPDPLLDTLSNSIMSGGKNLHPGNSENLILHEFNASLCHYSNQVSHDIKTMISDKINALEDHIKLSLSKNLLDNSK
ncbi:unnamed protein product, partial [marine sediment metagenome]